MTASTKSRDRWSSTICYQESGHPEGAKFLKLQSFHNLHRRNSLAVPKLRPKAGDKGLNVGSVAPVRSAAPCNPLLENQTDQTLQHRKDLNFCSLHLWSPIPLMHSHWSGLLRTCESRSLRPGSLGQIWCGSRSEPCGGPCHGVQMEEEDREGTRGTERLLRCRGGGRWRNGKRVEGREGDSGFEVQNAKGIGTAHMLVHT